MSLQASDVWFSYNEGSPVLRGVDVELHAGELLFLLGANGAGKSTLLRCLAGLLLPDKGRVCLEERELRALSSRQRAQYLALVPQSHSPVFTYTTRDMVLMGRSPHLKRLAGPTRRDREVTAWALQAVGLEELADRPYTALCGGEQRLALIARGLAQGAQVLLMDEPDANLDPAHQHRVLELADALAAEGLAVAVTSHNPNNALAYSHRAGLLCDGVLSCGPPQTVLNTTALEQAYGVTFAALSGVNGQMAVLPTTELDAPKA
ncbi:MAG: ABC transporter ATP-binding protein [Candidatus Bipolaricaulota bacterium]